MTKEYTLEYQLWRAIEKDDPKLLQELLKQGVNPNFTDNDIGDDGSNITPLHLAVMNDQKELVRILLDAKADPNAQNDVGWTPLHRAVMADDIDMARLLIEHGADVNAKDMCDDTPRDYADQRPAISHAMKALLSTAASKGGPAKAGIG